VELTSSPDGMLKKSVYGIMQGMLFRQLRAVNMSPEVCGWATLCCKFDKFRREMEKRFNEHLCSYTSIKHAVVVDSDIDVYDMEQVEWAKLKVLEVIKGS